MVGDDLHRDGKYVRPLAAQTFDLRRKFLATLDATVGGVLLADHANERSVPQRLRHRAVREGRTAGVNGREAIRHFRPHRKRAVAAMRIAHQKNLVPINVAEQQELAHEIRHERIGVAGVETIPGIVRRA